MVDFKLILKKYKQTIMKLEKWTRLTDRYGKVLLGSNGHMSNCIKTLHMYMYVYRLTKRDKNFNEIMINFKEVAYKYD